MSTPSTLLLCAGAASSLAAVWTLAGFSESSTPRFSPRVLAAAVLGLIAQLMVYGRAPSEARAQLSLNMLFGLASVAALIVGAAKLDGALLEKDGPRVVRRAAGLVAGSFFGMAALGAAALDLSSSSLALARLAWALMFGLVSSVVVVFAQRARYAGAGALALGARALVLGLIALGLLVGARLTSGMPRGAATVSPSAPALVSPASPPAAPSPPVDASVAPPTPAPAVAASSAAPPASASAAPPAAALPGKPGELQIEALVTRGMLEADARGGVERRRDRLQACLAEPKNDQSGALTLKVGIDTSGSVTYSRATGGDLVGTPLATCLLPVFYKMGFAAPASNNAGFEITLRAPSP